MPTPNEQYLIDITLKLQGDKTVQALTKALEDAGRAAPKVQKAMKGAAKDTRAFGRTAANAGYQVQDFFVQVSGGVEISRALSQQLPQLFIGFGVLGSALGVVAAVMPLVLDAFKAGEAAALNFDDSIEELDKTLGTLNSVIEGIDFTQWNKAWNAAGNAVKEAEIRLLEFRASVAESDLQKVLEVFSVEGGAGAAATGLDKFAASTLALFDIFGSEAQLLEQFGRDNFAEYLGVTPEATRDIRDMLIQLKNGRIDLDEFRAALLEAAGDEPNANFAKLIEQVVTLQARQKQVADTRKQIADANAALAAGIDLPTGDKAKKDKKKDSVVRLTAEEKQIQANIAEYDKYLQTLARTAEAYTLLYDPVAAYEAELQKIVEVQGLLTPEVTAAAVEAAAKRYAEATKEFSYADEAIKLFDESFNKMLDGVLMGTQDLAEGFEDMAKTIIAQLLKLLAYKAVFAGFGIDLGLPAGATGNAKGNVFSGGNVVPFANGGIVNSPTMFPMKSGVGLMGEAGPEAIVPLRRGAGGDLGIAAAPVNVVVNNMASGVRVNTRQTDQGLTLDVVMEQVSSAIRKGGNSIANAMEDSYSLGRGRAVY